MKTVISILFIAFYLGAFSQSTDLKGSYLGQTPPGLVPQKFAPGLITTDKYHEGCSGFLFDQTVFVFQRYDEGKFNGNVTYEMLLKNGKWTQSKELKFSREYRIGDFIIAPDGETMFFATRQKIPEIMEEQTGANIFKVTRDKNGWKTPEHLGLEVNTKYHESYPCISEDGTLYFFSRRPGGYGKSDLYTADLVKGKYTNIKNMGSTLNTEEHEWDTFIAPDKSYLIYCSTKYCKNGSDDFIITFSKEDGSWTEPVNMGDLFNTEKSENRPYVTQDGKYLFFTSKKDGTRDIYWVDARIIEELKPLELKNNN